MCIYSSHILSILRIYQTFLVSLACTPRLFLQVEQDPLENGSNRPNVFTHAKN